MEAKEFIVFVKVVGDVYEVDVRTDRTEVEAVQAANAFVEEQCLYLCVIEQSRAVLSSDTELVQKTREEFENMLSEKLEWNKQFFVNQ